MTFPTIRPGQTIRVTRVTGYGTKITYEGQAEDNGDGPYLRGFGDVAPESDLTIEVLPDPEPTEFGTLAQYDLYGDTYRVTLAPDGDTRGKWLDELGDRYDWADFTDHNVRIISTPPAKEAN
jgi:hypothetical protein